MTMPETESAVSAQEPNRPEVGASKSKRKGKAKATGREPVRMPGAAKSMYGAYLSVLALVLYSGFYTFHAFTSGWRYPWSYALMNDLNVILVWALALIGVVYLYYALIGRPDGWNEPLGAFRIVLAVLAILFWFVTQGTMYPYGLLQGLVNALGGPIRMFKLYELFLWLLLLINVIYIYARWAVSSRFPHLVASKPE